MHFLIKINLKRYFLLTALSTLLCLFFANDINDLFGILIVYCGTIINHIFLTQFVAEMIEGVKNKSSGGSSKMMIAVYAVGKMAILFLSLSLCVHFMGNKVIIALLNYVVQIFLLVFSIKKAI